MKFAGAFMPRWECYRDGMSRSDNGTTAGMAPGHQPISQPSLRDEIIGLAFVPGVETPG